ncbi:unnamed protein product [Sphagnum jensenii]
MGNTHSSILMFVEEPPELGDCINWLAAACTSSCGDTKLMMMSAHSALQILQNAKGSKYPGGATTSANAMASFQ